MRNIALVVVAAATFAASADLRADEITDQIQQALSAYERKDIPTATTALNAATSLLQQARADNWKNLLPPPPPGWTAQPPEGTTGAEAAIVGTGTSRKYTSGNNNVEVSFLSDSPLVQALSGVLTNPIVANLAGRPMVIDGRRIVYRQEDNSYTTLIANKILVRVTGNAGVGEETLKQFFHAIPFADIERMAQ